MRGHSTREDRRNTGKGPHVQESEEGREGTKETDFQGGKWIRNTWGLRGRKGFEEGADGR